MSPKLCSVINLLKQRKFEPSTTQNFRLFCTWWSPTVDRFTHCYRVDTADHAGFGLDAKQFGTMCGVFGTA